MIWCDHCGFGCQEDKAVKYFDKEPRTPKRPWNIRCKMCRKISNKERYESKKTQIRNQQKEWRNKNKDRVGVIRKNYRVRNKERIAASLKLWRVKNKAHISAYYENNKEKIKMRVLLYTKTPKGKEIRVKTRTIRRSRIKILATLTYIQWEYIIDIVCGNKCVYCGLEFTEENIPTRDHVIPLNQGGNHTMSNIRAACKSCNSSKGGRTPEQWGKPNPLLR